MLKQFSVGYHKAIKKIIGVSYHESNHYACELTNLHTFENYINKTRISFLYRILKSPCKAIKSNFTFFKFFSNLAINVNKLLNTKYQITDLMENDRDAVMARIKFVQNHEPQTIRTVLL